MGRFFTAVTAVAVMVTVALVLYAFGALRMPEPEKTLSELEMECLVAAIHSDARWPGDAQFAVRREIARTVLRYARVHGRDICDVFRNGLTLVPVGYKRWGPYFRTVDYVRASLEATEASWKADTQLVQELLKEKEIVGCATHYIRKARPSNWIAQSEWAQSGIRSRMRSVGRARNDAGQEVGTAEFFCP